MKTSLHAILCIVIRLGAVIIGVKLLIEMPGWFYAVHGSARTLDIIVPSLGYAFLLLVAFLLWLYPGFLARAAAGRSSLQIFESPISPKAMLHIALAVLGAFFVMRGLWAAIYQVLRLTFLAQIMGEDAVFGPAKAQCGIAIAADIAVVLVGGALVLGSRGLAEFIQRLRYGSGTWEEQQ